jgi:hypothetical protein
MATEILPISHLRHYGTRYQQAWRMADALRARQGTGHFPAWPDWCCLPAWYVERYIVAEGQPSFSIERAFDPMILAALCAWRMGKGVYRFDRPELLGYGKRPSLERSPVKFSCGCLNGVCIWSYQIKSFLAKWISGAVLLSWIGSLGSAAQNFAYVT